VVTGSGSVHHHSDGGAPPHAVRCHRCFLAETREGEGGHHHGDGGAPPHFSREGVFQGLGWWSLPA
jgi:hypothetical protein